MPAEEALADAQHRIEKKIKMAMLDKGYTVTSLADLLGGKKYRSRVSQAVHGGSAPRDRELRKKIYKILGI